MTKMRVWPGKDAPPEHETPSHSLFKGWTAEEVDGKRWCLRTWRVLQLVAKAVRIKDELWIARAQGLDGELAEAVASGALAGVKNDESVTVTASAQELREFLRERPRDPTWAISKYERVTTDDAKRRVSNDDLSEDAPTQTERLALAADK
ncbi:MAG: hypothetical protein KF847_04740 [Pirellulales bacterium]|nr:hypothetical protein [Pirellulales bacterium]